MSYISSILANILSANKPFSPTLIGRELLVLLLILTCITAYSCGQKNNGEEVSAEPENTKYKLGKKEARDEQIESEQETEFEKPDYTIYEEYPVLNASEILDEEIVKGEHHQVLEEVQSDCVWNSYVIDSPYGVFKAYNTDILKTRVNEIEAIAKLKQTSGAEAMASGAVDSAIRPFTAAINVATNPVDTAVGIPGGIVTFFKKIYYTGEKTVKVTGQTAKSVGGTVTGSSKDGEGDDDSYSGLTGDVSYLVDWYLGVSGGERRLAKELGVDPYTSNPVLAAELRRVAKYDRIGRFGFGHVDIPNVPGMGYVKDVNHYVWDKDPRELRDFNKKSLLKMGISEELAEEFLSSPYFSPSFQTTIVFSLQEMDGVTNREEVIEDAVVSTNIPQAQFFTKMVLLLTWFHLNESPFESFVNRSDILSGITVDNRLITIVPTDYVCWSEQLAEVAYFHNDVLTDIDAETREFWFTGDISERVKNEMIDLGWVVKGNAQIEPEDSEPDNKNKATKEINTELYRNLEKQEIETQD